MARSHLKHPKIDDQRQGKQDNDFQFIDVARREPDKKSLRQRKTEFVEIYQAFDDKLVMSQADRCLSCGNPYCQWQCPVHNHIPDWLKLVARTAFPGGRAVAPDQQFARGVRASLSAGSSV